ncbi:MAG TPA: hypothetical protein VN704_01295 [Verrucomicrobiae bacterium]|nr:hypothetical protein [Verrucomicrobiae bacterium]
MKHYTLDAFLNERPRKYRCKEYTISLGSVFFQLGVSYIINNKKIHSFLLNFTEPDIVFLQVLA